MLYASDLFTRSLISPPDMADLAFSHDVNYDKRKGTGSCVHLPSTLTAS